MQRIRIRVKEERRTLSPVAREIRLIILSIWTASLPERGRSRRVTWLRALERRSDTHGGEDVRISPTIPDLRRASSLN